MNSCEEYGIEKPKNLKQQSKYVLTLSQISDTFQNKIFHIFHKCTHKFLHDHSKTKNQIKKQTSLLFARTYLIISYWYICFFFFSHSRHITNTQTTENGKPKTKNTIASLNLLHLQVFLFCNVMFCLGVLRCFFRPIAPTFRRQTEGKAGSRPADLCLRILSLAPHHCHMENACKCIWIWMGDGPRNERLLLRRRRRLGDQTDTLRDLIT